MESPTFKTKSGRVVTVEGDPQLLTMDRIQLFSEHFDSDPRIVSISLQSTDLAENNQTFLRATAPAGCLIAIAPNDLFDHEAQDWALAASNRGLWHDWFLTTDRDVQRATVIKEASEMDVREAQDPSSSHYHARNNTSIEPNAMSLTVDITWLGEHETGSQVLTTAAIAALAEQDRITSINLIGKANESEIPPYAAHLTQHPKVNIGGNVQTDILWYPNQIDQRVDIDQARSLGKRVITTYLDLIAYDIPRYHASTDAHAVYRALQRKIALSVDGITTISKDVAKRLYQETPRLDHRRIKAIPLGLDHITADTEMTKPKELKTDKPFLLVLGNDFLHKNRDFAIKVWQELLDQGHSIDLVLAGLHVKSSSSKRQEQELIDKHVNLRGTIHTLGHVSSEERAWLLANARAVLYPSSAEGFGFVPHEAAALDTTSSFAGFGPLQEISGAKNLPKSWSIQEFASNLSQSLANEDAKSQRLDQLRTVQEQLTWQHFATELTEFFSAIAELPTVPTSTLGPSPTADAAALAQVLGSRSWKLTAPLRRITGKN